MHSRALDLVVVTAALIPFPAFARDLTPKRPIFTSPPAGRAFDNPGTAAAMAAVAAVNTTVLYAASFDAGGCTSQGWTAVDMTTQTGVFFHVDDYAGLPPADFSPLAGTKSLWCGARAATTGPLCGYLTLPGYGNNWDQMFTTKDCMPVTGDLDVSFLLRVDSEPHFDAVALEYNTDCSGSGWWTPFDGGIYGWDGSFELSINKAYSVPSGPLKVRFRFRSDNGYSDEDALYPTNGAVHIDNLQVEGLALEDFEDEVVGATSTQDWEASAAPPFGIYAGLLNGMAVVQQDDCVRDVTCLWNFFTGSTYYGSIPDQKVVPYGNGLGQYLNNEIWSPEIPLAGSGSELALEFSAYRDLPLSGVVFYYWRVREVGGDCNGVWRDRGHLFYGGSKEWYRERELVGDLIDMTSANSVQVSLGVVDECRLWCGVFGESWHTHAPLFDNVRLLRFERAGPLWTIRDVDQFQDNFAGDGTLTGTVRADMATDVGLGLRLIPGDSSVVRVSDPVEGLGTDPSVGGAAVYCYVSVWPQGQSTKSGAALSGDLVRYPAVDTWTDARGASWTCLRMDSVRSGSAPVTNAYCVDLNDNLFTPGDTICFFYAARATNGVESYAFGSSLEAAGPDREVAAANASEFTCLPAGGPARGGDILYVDGMDGRGAQPYWDTAFAALGLLDKVDRYDVRGPASDLKNRPGGRVVDPVAQLAPYRVILWDCGDLWWTTLGGATAKSNDTGMLNTFLASLPSPGGVFLCGDNTPGVLLTMNDTSTTEFKTTWLPFTLVSTNHRNTFGISPEGVPAATGCYFDSFVISGACPGLNDFDVMAPSGASQIAIGYGTPAATNGALLYNGVNNGSTNVGVLLGGFSFIYIRDDDNDGVSDRARFLADTLCKLGSATPPPTSTPPLYVNALGQNYPNPFNPQTTITFSLRARGGARLAVYDVTGARVRTLASEELPAGAHTRVWDGRNDSGVAVSSGVYFYELVAGDFRQTRKMVLLK